MWNSFAILDLSTPDLLIILAIVVLLFGGKKLPELARSLGASAKELRTGLRGDVTETASEVASEPVATPALVVVQAQVVQRPMVAAIQRDPRA